MSITFPKSWVAGETLTASDTKGNLDAMRDKAQKLSSSDVNTTSSWITTAHIMRGRYDSVTNITNNVSGVFGGRNSGGTWQNVSFVTRWMMPTAFNSNGTQFVPLSCIQLDITHPQTVLFQWWMNHQSPRDGDGTDGGTRFFVYKNDTNTVGMNHRVPEQLEHTYSGSSTNTPVLLDGTFNTNGHLLFDSSSEILNFGIGLTAWSNAGKCQQVSWSVSIECFYM
jgi:hypothetical protein